MRDEQPFKAAPLEARIEQAVAPLIGSEGYDLVLVEFVARQRVLRLYIDHSNGVTLDDCTRVSHLVGDVLDAEGLSDAIDGRYTLEVSSPGLDRPLARPQHFQRFVGRHIKVATKEPQAGRRNFMGELVEADDAGIRLVVEGRAYALEYGAIERARLVPEL